MKLTTPSNTWLCALRFITAIASFCFGPLSLLSPSLLFAVFCQHQHLYFRHFFLVQFMCDKFRMTQSHWNLYAVYIILTLLLQQQCHLVCRMSAFHTLDQSLALVVGVLSMINIAWNNLPNILLTVLWKLLPGVHKINKTERPPRVQNLAIIANISRIF